MQTSLLSVMALALLPALCAAAQSQPPTPGAPLHRENDQQRRPEVAASGAAPSGGVQAAVPLQNPRSIEKLTTSKQARKNAGADEDQESTSPWWVTLDGWAKFGDAFGGVATLLALFVVFWQALLFRKQLGLMSASIRDTAAAANAAVVNAQAAMKSAEVAERAMHFAERPWLHVTIEGGLTDQNSIRGFNPGDAPLRPVVLHANVTLRNFGRSPAMIEWHEVGFPSVRSVDRIGLHRHLFPDETLAVGDVARDHVIGIISFRPENREHFMSHPPPLIGRIRYRLPHGQLREFGFAYVLGVLWADKWRRVGGAEAHYDREVQEDDEPNGHARQEVTPWH